MESRVKKRIDYGGFVKLIFEDGNEQNVLKDGNGNGNGRGEKPTRISPKIRTPKDQSQDRVNLKTGRSLIDEGFLALPRKFIRTYHNLGITKQEFLLIIHVWSYKFGQSNPYPKMQTVAKEMGVEAHVVTNLTRKLIAKGFLKTKALYSNKPGEGPHRATTEWDLEGLFNEIENLK